MTLQVIFPLIIQHLEMVGIALVLSILCAWTIVAITIVFPILRGFILTLLSLIYTIPSLALMALILPWFGLNFKVMIATVVLYSQLILVRNIITGLDNLDPNLREAAQGLGMSWWQQWWWVELPLIFPTFLAGVRLTTIVAIATITFGAKVNAGGVGVLLFEGIQTNRYDKIMVGSLLLVLLAIGFNLFFSTIESRFSITTETNPKT